MSKLQPLLSIEKHNNEIIENILTNIVKMMTNRNLLNNTDLNKNIKLLTNNTNGTSENHKLQLNKNVLMIKIIQQNITSINKTSNIFEFLDANRKKHSLVVVKDISRRALDDISIKFPQAEIFLEKELMINILDYSFVPRHVLLNDEQKQEFYSQYNIKNKNMLKIFSKDPVSKYFNAKEGDIFKITRPSKNSGYINIYRLVIK